jgi:hypothetical protein
MATAALALAHASPTRWHAVELRTPNGEWQPHDMPLFLDHEWAHLLRLVDGAFATAAAHPPPVPVARSGAQPSTSDPPAVADPKGPAAAEGGGYLTRMERARGLSALFGRGSSRVEVGAGGADVEGKAEGSGTYARML